MQRPANTTNRCGGSHRCGGANSHIILPLRRATPRDHCENLHSRDSRDDPVRSDPPFSPTQPSTQPSTFTTLKLRPVDMSVRPKLLWPRGEGGELEGVRCDRDGQGWVPLELPPRHMHMRLGLVACSFVVACVLLPGCAAFPAPTGRTREGASSPAPRGTEALESPAAAAPRVAASGAAASAAAEEQDHLQKALEEWHIAYRNLKVALRQICTGEESCVEQDSGWQPAQHSASGVSPPSRFTVRRSSDVEASGGDEAPQRGASGETHAERTSPVTMSWRAMSLRGIVLQGFTVALSPLMRAIAWQLLLAKKTYMWARDRLPDHMRQGLVDLEGLSVAGWMGTKKWWRAITGDGQLWNVRFIYFHLFLVHLSLLPVTLHPLETMGAMVNHVLNLVWQRPNPWW
jgi:hypothetical protein